MAKNLFILFISSELAIKLIIFLLLIIAVKCQEKDISEEESLEAQLENNKLLLWKIRDKLNSFHNDRHKFKRSAGKNLRNRLARGTFLRMDPNRRTFSSQVLAKKMAEESLRSPKMQETLKRLTEVRSAEGHRKVKKSVPAHKNLKKKSHKPLVKKKKAIHSHLKKLKKPGHKRSKGSSNSKHSGSIVSKVKARRDDKLKLPDKSVKSSRGLLKLDVKRSDVDCTADRTRIFNPSLVAEQSNALLSRHTRHTFPLLEKLYNSQFNDLLRRNFAATTDNYLGPYLGSRDKIYYGAEQKINKDPIELNSVDLFENNYKSELLKNWNDFPFLLGKKSVPENIFNSTDKSVEKESKHVKAKVEKVNNGDPTCETKEVAREILNRIIEELEELKNDRNKSFYGEGSPCNVSGNWISVQAGVQLEITTVNRHKLDVKIKKQKLIKTINHRGFLNETWNVTGQSFFGFDAPFSLTAINCHTKSLASFIGTCKTCNGNDMIQGIWTTIHEPHDCRYFSIAINSYNDIFRRIKKN